jgi:hypothetical protein
MAAAAHDVGCAEHDEIAGLNRLARGFLVDRKLGDADALRPKCLSHLRAVIVMRQHRDVCVSRSLGQPRDRCGDVVTSGNDTLHQGIERLVRKTGAFDHTAAAAILVTQCKN